jgi:hypothetical protein
MTLIKTSNVINAELCLAHGAYDSRKDDSFAQYDSISLKEIGKLVETPQAVEKVEADFIIPSEYRGHMARSHSHQREMGEYWLLALDIDEGSPTLTEVKDAVKEVIGNAHALLYSSAGASTDERKWRVLIPLAQCLFGEQYTKAQMALFQLMRDQGIICDPALSRSAQPIYLPNVPPDRRDIDGNPLFYHGVRHVGEGFLDAQRSKIWDIVEFNEQQEIIAQKKAELAAADRARERAQKREQFGTDVDPIEVFNERHSVADMLLRYGYEQQGRSPHYRSPYQTSGSYATKDFGTHWVSLSSSDANAGVGMAKGGDLTYCFGDAFDLYAHFEHGGDMKKAVREYGAEIRPSPFEKHNSANLDDFEEAETTTETVQPAEVAEVAEVAAQPDPEAAWPTPLSEFDSSKLPVRQWVYGFDYIRGYVSVLASAGGIGKTSMVIVEALAIATGRPLLGTEVKEQTNVWLVNLEDPRVEIEMRVLAAMQEYGVTPDEVRGKLFIDGEDTFNVLLAAETRDGIQTNDDMLSAMTRKIEENSIGVVVFDPFVSLHQVNENSNSGIQTVVALLRKLARDANVSVLLVHHIRKGNGEDATIDSVRGAGALIGAARAARVINRITEDDAVRMGVDPGSAKGIFRVDDGKSNLAPPAEKAVYRQMKGVQIDNGEWIGVAVEFKLPDLFENITTKMTRACQDIVGGAAQNEKPYRQNPQAKDWVGHAIGHVIDIDTSDKAGKQKMGSILKQWYATDVLRVESQPDERSGREVPCVFVGEWISWSEM